MSSIELVERKLRDALGLRERPGIRAQLQRELTLVCREHGLDAVQVAERLDREPWLVRRLGSAVTIDETFFLRHPEHFAVLRAELPSLLRESQAPPMLWSAGCATGEEPFSMATTLCCAFGPEVLQQVHILATDISESALRVARRGVYGGWSFRGADETWRARYFRPCENTQEFQLNSAIQEAVSFRHLPLETQLLELAPASIDVIFFRNVALYLTDAALARIYAGFARVLKPGALLLLGPADPLPNASEFSRTRQFDTFLHRRPVPPPREAPLCSAPRAPISPEPDALSHAERLADRGLTSEALSLVERQIEQLGRSADRLALRGRIRLAAGDPSGCVSDLREALALAPDQLLLRFHYALGLEANQQIETCRSELQRLLHALDARSDADGMAISEAATTLGSIRRAAQELLRRVE